jgi:hypothetical protein
MAHEIIKQAREGSGIYGRYLGQLFRGLVVVWSFQGRIRASKEEKGRTVPAPSTQDRSHVVECLSVSNFTLLSLLSNQWW